MSQETIWIASGMGVAIVAMALYIKSLHKHHTTSNKELNERVTTALVDNAKSNEHLANAIEGLPENITNKIATMLPNQRRRK